MVIPNHNVGPCPHCPQLTIIIGLSHCWLSNLKPLFVPFYSKAILFCFVGTQKKELLEVCMIDFYDAYDLLDHELFPKKEYNFDEASLEWIQSYLGERKHCLKWIQDKWTSGLWGTWRSSGLSIGWNIPPHKLKWSARLPWGSWECLCKWWYWQW